MVKYEIGALYLTIGVFVSIWVANKFRKGGWRPVSVIPIVVLSVLLWWGAWPLVYTYRDRI